MASAFGSRPYRVVDATLPEQLLLLALDDTTERIRGRDVLDIGLAGAELAELVLIGRLVADGKRFRVTDPGPTGDADLDVVVARLSGDGYAARRRSPISGSRNLVRTYLSRLAGRGWVTERAGRALGLFPVTRYQLANTTAKRQVRAVVDAVVAAEHASTAPEAILGWLAQAVGLGRYLFPGRTGKRERRRLRHVVPESSIEMMLILAVVRRAVRSRQAAAAAG